MMSWVSKIIMLLLLLSSCDNVNTRPRRSPRVSTEYLDTVQSNNSNNSNNSSNNIVAQDTQSVYLKYSDIAGGSPDVIDNSTFSSDTIKTLTVNFKSKDEGLVYLHNFYSDKYREKYGYAPDSMFTMGLLNHCFYLSYNPIEINNSNVIDPVALNMALHRIYSYPLDLWLKYMNKYTIYDIQIEFLKQKHKEEINTKKYNSGIEFFDNHRPTFDGKSWYIQ